MKLLTLARDLRRRRARERQQLFVCEGVRTVEELLRSPVEPRGALIAPQLSEQPRGAALLAALQARRVPLEEVSAADFASAAETETPQGVLAMAEIPSRPLSSLPKATPVRLLVLDAVQDPGNVGTMLRTAAAMGTLATVALPGTVDLWNAKVVRSAMGAHFHHAALAATWAQLDSFRAERGVSLWGADTEGTSVDALVRDGAIPAGLALAVGNEGSGLSAHVRESVDALVALPIAAPVESLNVAVATGILLYLLRP